MNVDLLRSKMALKGHYNINDLESVIHVKPINISRRLAGEVAFKPPEIKAITNYYDLTDSEAVEIFDLRG